MQFTSKQDGSLVSADGSPDGIVSALLQSGVDEFVEARAKVACISKEDCGGFRLMLSDGRLEHYDCIILATGNSFIGHHLAKSLGHTISQPVRSCFAFVLNRTEIVSNLDAGHHFIPHARISFKVTVDGQKRPRMFKSEGPAQLEVSNDTIILGGSAALSLSSMACSELNDAKYSGSLLVHFCPDYLGGKVESLEEWLWQYRQNNPRAIVGERCPLQHHWVNYDSYDWETDSFETITNECIPSDLWQGLTQACGAPYGAPWSKMSQKKVRQLAETIVGCPLAFKGRYTGSDYPFMNAGGIHLNEMDMSTLQSKVVDGMYCCGQVLDGCANQLSFANLRDFATAKLAGESAAYDAIRFLEGTTAVADPIE